MLGGAGIRVVTVLGAVSGTGVATVPRIGFIVAPGVRAIARIRIAAASARPTVRVIGAGALPVAGCGIGLLGGGLRCGWESWTVATRVVSACRSGWA